MSNAIQTYPLTKRLYGGGGLNPIGNYTLRITGLVLRYDPFPNGPTTVRQLPPVLPPHSHYHPSLDTVSLEAHSRLDQPVSHSSAPITVLPPYSVP